MSNPLVTIAVPSYNQGNYLDEALSSIFSQQLPVEVYVLDGGSTDNSLAVIKKWEKHLISWRSYKDAGQAAAINEGIAKGSADYVCWLNSDDWLLPNALEQLIAALQANPKAPVAYGKADNFIEKTQKTNKVWVEPFNEQRLAFRCIISQPATLIRRSAWEAVGGLDERLHMAMDYDLWWRLYKQVGSFVFIDKVVAVNRQHALTKTQTNRQLHYSEAITTVAKHYGRVPLKWRLLQPYAVWWKSFCRGF